MAISVPIGTEHYVWLKEISDKLDLSLKKTMEHLVSFYYSEIMEDSVEEMKEEKEHAAIIHDIEVTAPSLIYQQSPSTVQVQQQRPSTVQVQQQRNVFATPQIRNESSPPTKHTILPPTPTKHTILPPTPTKHTILPPTPTKHTILPPTPTKHTILPPTPTKHTILPPTPIEYTIQPPKPVSPNSPPWEKHANTLVENHKTISNPETITVPLYHPSSHGCPSCGASKNSDAKFCHNCGHSL